MESRFHEIRSVPLWLVREYLEELDGRASDETHVTGDGWQATLEKMEPVPLGSLRIGRVSLVLEGEAQVIESLWAKLEMKLLRAGG